MKRKELIKIIAGVGCVLVRHGDRHDLYRNPKTGKQQPVPRHVEIDENLARNISIWALPNEPIMRLGGLIKAISPIYREQNNIIPCGTSGKLLTAV